jgi:hypothetical protein
MFAPLIRIPVGVVVERRKAQSAWIEFTWRPVSVLAGRPDAVPWTRLAADQEAATFYAGAAEIELYRSETPNYRDNLNTGVPLLWVALRPTGEEPPYNVFIVTADPAEGEALSAPGSDLVEALPMPEGVRAQIAAFVAEHHVERPFAKRKLSRADPEALARRAPVRKERE